MPEQVCVGKLRRRHLGNLVISGPWGCAGLRAKPQAIPSGGFTNASVLGDYFLGTIDRASARVIDASGVENLDGVNTWTSMEDASLPSGNCGDVSGTAPYNITSSGSSRQLTPRLRRSHPGAPGELGSKHRCPTPMPRRTARKPLGCSLPVCAGTHAWVTRITAYEATSDEN
jgi:hypothetical protein